MSNMTGVTSATRCRLLYKVSHLQRLDKVGDSDDHSLESDVCLCDRRLSPHLFFISCDSACQRPAFSTRPVRRWRRALREMNNQIEIRAGDTPLPGPSLSECQPGNSFAYIM